LWYRYIRGVVSGMEVNSSHLFDPNPDPKRSGSSVDCLIR
jgi:hypothetical protein